MSGKLYAKHDFPRGLGGLHSLPDTKAPTPPNSPGFSVRVRVGVRIRVRRGKVRLRVRVRISVRVTT